MSYWDRWVSCLAFYHSQEQRHAQHLSPNCRHWFICATGSATIPETISSESINPVFKSCLLSNTSRDSDSTTASGSPFQYLITLSLKKFLPVFSLNLPWHKLCPLILSLATGGRAWPPPGCNPFQALVKSHKVTLELLFLQIKLPPPSVAPHRTYPIDLYLFLHSAKRWICWLKSKDSKSETIFRMNRDWLVQQWQNLL